MFPARLAPVAYGFVLSGLMSLLVSAIATYSHAGSSSSFAGLWLAAWFTSWPAVFSAVLIVAAVAHGVVQRLVAA